MSEKYLIGNWVSFVQQIQHLVSRGYINTFNNLNGLPSWGGIVSQKIKMKDQLVKKMKKQLPQEKVYVFSKKMIINTKRTAVKVF
ncbi:hypothetical protein MHI18_05130 [Peribacillus sp. FSL H8-0477]|uniref:hypothetical protein n=1 Tax=Peribacillus sp. FSL H8-0477 TaxID=2921388 RepID=UPI0030F75612